jgi:DNA-binding response OmpR family regulator
MALAARLRKDSAIPIIMLTGRREDELSPTRDLCERRR